jgi:hypothetical protein
VYLIIYVWAYIMHMFESIIFMGTTSNAMSAFYMTILKDF